MTELLSHLMYVAVFHKKYGDTWRDLREVRDWSWVVPPPPGWP